MRMIENVWWKLKDLLIHTDFLTMIIISLFCCEKVFTLINIWMIGKNSMKINYLKKWYFCSLSNVEDITDGDYTQAKRACKDFVTKKLVDCY